MDQNLVQIAIALVSGFLLIISGLLTWIGFMHKETKIIITRKNEEQDARLNKHDEKFDKVHSEIHEISKTSGEAIAVIRTQIENNSKLIERIGYRNKKG